MTLTITIPGKPQPQQRMKATIRGQHASVYEPAESRNWKATAQQHMADALRASGEKIFDVALRVEIVAVFPLPAGEHRKKPTPRRWHTKANGDCDNIAKAVLDAGNAVLWRDDASVVELIVRKYVAAQDESPRVLVRVTPIVDAPAPSGIGDDFAVVTRGPVDVEQPIPMRPETQIAWKNAGRPRPLQTTISGSAAIRTRQHQ